MLGLKLNHVSKRATGHFTQDLQDYLHSYDNHSANDSTVKIFGRLYTWECWKCHNLGNMSNTPLEAEG